MIHRGGGVKLSAYLVRALVRALVSELNRGSYKLARWRDVEARSMGRKQAGIIAGAEAGTARVFFSQLRGVMEGKLSVDFVSPDTLVLDPRNARKHDERNIAAIQASIARFGQDQILVVRREGRVVVKGNGRLIAMRNLGVASIAVVFVDDGEAVAIERSLADNKSSDLASWDVRVLGKLLGDVGQVAAEELGWSRGEFERVVNPEGLQAATASSDDVPRRPAVPRSVPGVYALGDHRVLAGSCRDRDAVSALFGERRVGMVFTGPPHGVEYAGKTRDALTITITITGDRDVGVLLDESLGIARDLCKAGAVWYVCAPSGPELRMFADVLHRFGIWRQTITWVKNTIVIGHSDFHYQHESILVGTANDPRRTPEELAEALEQSTEASEAGGPGERCDAGLLREAAAAIRAYADAGDDQHESLFYGWLPGVHLRPPHRSGSTVWQFPKPAASRDHPTMKPVGLVVKAIETSSLPGDLVYDPFLGSGTTLVAAQGTGRVCYGCEIDLRYVDVIIDRWEAVTGEKAVLVSEFAANDVVE